MERKFGQLKPGVIFQDPSNNLETMYIRTDNSEYKYLNINTGELMKSLPDDYIVERTEDAVAFENDPE